VRTTVTALLSAAAAALSVLPLAATASEPPRHAIGFSAGESFCGLLVYEGEGGTEIHVANKSFRVPISTMRLERIVTASPLAVLGMACIGYALHRRSRKSQVSAAA
jgi:hypothetical protein